LGEKDQWYKNKGGKGDGREKVCGGREGGGGKKLLV
jgi:hypothetical protein